MPKKTLIASLSIILVLIFVILVTYNVYNLKIDNKTIEISESEQLKQKIEELLFQVPSPSTIMPDGTQLAMDVESILDLNTGKTYEPNMEASNKLIAMSEKVVPILIEIYKERRTKNKDIGELVEVLACIGTDESIDFLKSISQSEIEEPNIKAEVNRALNRNKCYYTN